jgi:hypothetical protein
MDFLSVRFGFSIQIKAPQTKS